MTRERIDRFLLRKGLVKSCSEAEKLILAGEVYSNGEKICKPSRLVDAGTCVEIRKQFPYVSRGGLKLERALSEFKIQVKNKICLDVGASTGGFTDCLLKHGAKLVYALDVGYRQLDWSLRNHPQVINIEKTNIRYFDKRELRRIIQQERGQLSPPKAGPCPTDGRRAPLAETINDFLPELATVDVSFISLEKVIPKVCSMVRENGKIIALIKPQFEAGKGKTKKGIVKETKIHQEIVEKIKKFVQNLGLELLGITNSGLKGAKGNIEYFIAFKNSSLILHPSPPGGEGRVEGGTKGIEEVL